MVLQAGGEPLGAVGQLAVGDDLAVIVVAVEADVGAFGVGAHVPVQHLGQGVGGAGHRRASPRVIAATS